MCLDNNLPYEDVSVTNPTQEAWANEFKPKMPFGQVPLLKDGDLEVAQASAILRYIGRQCGAHPTDVKDAARADMINDAANDLREAYARMMWTCYETGREDHIQKATTQIHYVENLLRKWENDFILPKICFADYNLYDVLDVHEVLCPGFLDQFPTLKSYHHRIGSRPAIKAFRDSELNKSRKYCGNGKQ